MRVRVVAVTICLSASTLGAQLQRRAPIDTQAVRGMVDAESAARSVSTPSWFWRGVLWSPLYPLGIPVVIVQARNSDVFLQPPPLPNETRPSEYRAAYDSAYVATVRRKRRNSSFKGLAAGGVVLTIAVAAGTAGR